MAIIVSCRCGGAFQTVDENAGREARCPICGDTLTVPGQLTDRPAGVERLSKSEAPFSGRAIASLVLGLGSLAAMVLAGVPAIALGAIALADIRRSGGRLRGASMAMMGIALGVMGSTVMTVSIPLALVPLIREPYLRAQCVDNLKQIGLAMHNFHSDKGHFPAHAIVNKQGHPLLSWRVAILPYLGREEAALYSKFHLKEPWDSPHNRALIAEMPAIYHCPSERGAKEGMTGYQLMLGPKIMRIQDMTAGTSNTLLATESDELVPWTAPEDIPFGSTDSRSNVGSRHPGHVNQLKADGSVRSYPTVPTPASAQAKRTPASSSQP